MSTMTISLSGSKGHLIFRQSEFNEHGVATSEKVGAKAIDPARAEKALSWAKTQEWEFTGEPVNGFYTMELKAAAPAQNAENTVTEGEIVQ